MKRLIRLCGAATAAALLILSSLPLAAATPTPTRTPTITPTPTVTMTPTVTPTVTLTPTPTRTPTVTPTPTNTPTPTRTPTRTPTPTFTPTDSRILAVSTAASGTTGRQKVNDRCSPSIKLWSSSDWDGTVTVKQYATDDTLEPGTTVMSSAGPLDAGTAYYSFQRSPYYEITWTGRTAGWLSAAQPCKF